VIRAAFACIVISLLLMVCRSGVRADDDLKVFEGLSGSSACSSRATDHPASDANGLDADLAAPQSCADPSITLEAKSGCCSHHGGVCGCDSSTGHQRCCDGRDSPSCGC
jgi:hypothetical protein